MRKPNEASPVEPNGSNSAGKPKTFRCCFSKQFMVYCAFTPGFWSTIQTYFFIAEQTPQLCTFAKGEKEDDEVESALSCSDTGFAFNGASLNSVYKPAVNILT